MGDACGSRSLSLSPIPGTHKGLGKPLLSDTAPTAILLLWAGERSRLCFPSSACTGRNSEVNLKLNMCKWQLGLKQNSWEGVHKLYQDLFFFSPPVFVSGENYTCSKHLGCRGAQLCAVSKGQIWFSEAQELPVGRSTGRSVEPERRQSPLPMCSPQFCASCRRGRAIRLQQNSVMHRVVPEELIGGVFDSLYLLNLL